MTTDWKALCAELLAWAEKTSSNYYKQADVLLRARAALSEQPVGEGPPAVTTGAWLHPAYEPGDGSADGAQMVELAWWHPQFGCDSLQMVVDNARAILARWGNPAPPHDPWKEVLLDALVCNFLLEKEHENDPKKALNDLIAWEKQLATDPLINPAPQPVPEGNHPAKPDGSLADGEVAELVKKLHRDILDTTSQRWWDLMAFSSTAQRDHLNDITRAADLLQRLSPPQPVPVSERLPGPEDCDVEGRCWMLGKVERDWRLINPEKSGLPHLRYCFSHWLPFHALPLPEQEVEQ